MVYFLERFQEMWYNGNMVGVSVNPPKNIFKSFEEANNEFLQFNATFNIEGDCTIINCAELKEGVIENGEVICSQSWGTKYMTPDMVETISSCPDLYDSYLEFVNMDTFVH